MLVLGFLACVCCVVAIPLAWGLYAIFTTPPPPPSTVTQTGEPYYLDLSCGDSEHLPIPYPIEDAIVDESDLERVQRIRARIAKPTTLTPSTPSQPVKVIRSIDDRKTIEQDHTLQIIK